MSLYRGDSIAIEFDKKIFFVGERVTGRIRVITAEEDKEKPFPFGGIKITVRGTIVVKWKKSLPDVRSYLWISI